MLKRLVQQKTKLLNKQKKAFYSSSSKSTKQPKVVQTVQECKQVVKELKNSTKETSPIGFVPTMGALHSGHISLVQRARTECPFVGVSIFVNPKQFGPNEDYLKYPRVFEQDLEMLSKEEVDFVFAPRVEDMYTDDFSTYVNIEGIEGSTEEGKCRPGHFRGVATVVTKLFNIVQPDKAFFGAKDAVQCMVIKKMVRDLNMNVDVVICDTVREKDGLAKSSRNVYLGEQERNASPVLYRSMMAAVTAFRAQQNQQLTKKQAVEMVMSELAKEPLVSKVQYVSIMDPLTIKEVSNDTLITSGHVLSLACVVGKVRLIDTTTF